MIFLALVGGITLFLCAISGFAYLFGYIEGRAQSRKDV